MKFEQTMFLKLSLVVWKMETCTVAPCLTHELTHSLNRCVRGGSVLGLGYNTEHTDVVLTVIECAVLWITAGSPERGYESTT